MSDAVQVATTCDSEEAAKALARDAVGSRLAACAQVEGPISSVYRWQGEVETTAEWRVVYKTTTASADALEAFVLEHHPYETPEVLRTPVVGGNPAYLAWMRASVG